MICGFTGTRQGPTPAQHTSMRRFLVGMPMDGFIHGGAPGCDTFAHWIVRKAHPEALIDIYPANVRSIGSLLAYIGPTLDLTTIHPAAPPLDRDRTMVELVHGLLAVPRTDQEAASGTWATMRYAREIGRTVYVVKQDGRIVRFA